MWKLATYTILNSQSSHTNCVFHILCEVGTELEVPVSGMLMLDYATMSFDTLMDKSERSMNGEKGLQVYK